MCTRGARPTDAMCLQHDCLRLFSPSLPLRRSVASSLAQARPIGQFEILAADILPGESRGVLGQIGVPGRRAQGPAWTSGLPGAGSISMPSAESRTLGRGAGASGCPQSPWLGGSRDDSGGPGGFRMKRGGGAGGHQATKRTSSASGWLRRRLRGQAGGGGAWTGSGRKREAWTVGRGPMVTPRPPT